MRPVDADQLYDRLMRLSGEAVTERERMLLDRALCAIDDAPTAVPPWTRVGDALPDVGAKCLVCAAGQVTVARHIAANDWITAAMLFPAPTHWMPLPEAPGDRTEADRDRAGRGQI